MRAEVAVERGAPWVRLRPFWGTSVLCHPRAWVLDVRPGLETVGQGCPTRSGPGAGRTWANARRSWVFCC